MPNTENRIVVLGGLLLAALLPATSPARGEEPPAAPIASVPAGAEDREALDQRARDRLTLALEALELDFDLAEPGPPAEKVTPPEVYSLWIERDLHLGGNVFRFGRPFLHQESLNLGLGYDALGQSVPLDLTIGNLNTALGWLALGANSTGFGNTASGTLALAANKHGDGNTAFGTLVLRVNTGSWNTAAGFRALEENTGGFSNTAAGAFALVSNTSGHSNTALGEYALQRNTVGVFNSASGTEALQSNTTGQYNVAIGHSSLRNSTTGSRNIAIGAYAGSSNLTGSDNIFIGSSGPSSGDQSGLIWIGSSQHSSVRIRGIFGSPVPGGVPVHIDSADRLGTPTSSRRFKEDIGEMGDTSAGLFFLRPVTFRYRREVAGDGARPLEFGLVAEEVAEVYPQLVVDDELGRPHAVRYEALIPMLVNELHRLERRIAALEAGRVTASEERVDRSFGGDRR